MKVLKMISVTYSNEYTSNVLVDIHKINIYNSRIYPILLFKEFCELNLYISLHIIDINVYEKKNIFYFTQSNILVTTNTSNAKLL